MIFFVLALWPNSAFRWTSEAKTSTQSKEEIFDGRILKKCDLFPVEQPQHQARTLNPFFEFTMLNFR